MSARHIATLASAALAATAMLTLAACTQPKKISFEDARARFAQSGPQPGSPLPKLTITNLQGQPLTIPMIQGDKPLVLVTASLTCTVAQHNQAALEDMKRRFGDKIAVLVLYTIEAHPKGDPCPYTGEEWAMPENAKQGIEHKQPTTQSERLYLARLYRDKFAPTVEIAVDTMDNASWKALGEAPNLGLLVGPKGIIREREGWFDPEKMEKALARMGVKPNVPPTPPATKTSAAAPAKS